MLLIYLFYINLFYSHGYKKIMLITIRHFSRKDLFFIELSNSYAQVINNPWITINVNNSYPDYPHV